MLGISWMAAMLRDVVAVVECNIKKEIVWVPISMHTSGSVSIPQLATLQATGAPLET